MKKTKIIVGIIIAIILFSSLIVAFAYTINVQPVEAGTVEFIVEPMTEFYDKSVGTYTKGDLAWLIKEYQKIQATAQDLIDSATSLGFPADDRAIENAKTQKNNAQLIINYYTEFYNKKLAEEEAKKQEEAKAKMAAKSNEFPVATTIWTYMKALGWNDYVCAGVMGNIMAEVGGQSLNIRYNAYGNGYYGICQWNKAYSRIWGTDLKTQLNFLRDTIKYEMDTYGFNYYKGFNYNSFLNLQDAQHAALAFAKCYERCGSGSYGVRQNNAIKAYNYFVK